MFLFFLYFWMFSTGCDRHLLGLYLIAMEQGMDIPQIFMDPAFVKR